MWSLARITKVHPGDNERGSVFTIKTVRLEFKRPITQLDRILCMLE